MTTLHELVQKQVRHAYSNAPAIRQIMESAGVGPDDIQNVDDLARIPVISKDQLQSLQQENPPFGGFLAVPLQDLKRIYLSPGPIYDPHGYGEAAALQVATEAFTAAGFGAGDIVLNTFLYHMVPAGLLMDEAMDAIAATVVPLGPGNTDLQVKVIMDLGVTAYVGTPSFLQMIYAKISEFGIPLEAVPLKKAFFSAEPFTPSQREEFAGYGLSVSQAYATADLGIIAYERPGEQGLVVPQHLVVQVCDPQTGALLPEGELGEVVVTTFNNSYPLIRFGTGDLSILDDHGDHKKLRGWMGRSGEAVKVRGMFLHPNALKQAAAGFPNIDTLQAVIGREGTRDTVTLQVVLREGNLDSEALKGAVKNAARLSIDEVQVVEQVEGSRVVRDTRRYD